jgi:hypothetical protein
MKLTLISDQLVMSQKGLTAGGSAFDFLMIWHFRHDWLFTPFVVVVGCKYFFAGAGVPSF